MEGTSEAEVLRRLEADGLLRQDDAARHRTTERWQAAVARVAYRLLREGADDSDLRLPVACALVEVYGTLPDQELALLTEVLTPIEAAELDPRVHLERRAAP